ncbi:MAG: MoaD/ThiS family protein [Lewinella sp.]
MKQTHSILCFGIARDITGSGTITMHLRPRPKVLDLRTELLAQYPAFGELVNFAIARNEAYADDQEILEPNDTLAIIPPVSGG